MKNGLVWPIQMIRIPWLAISCDAILPDKPPSKPNGNMFDIKLYNGGVGWGGVGWGGVRIYLV